MCGFKLKKFLAKQKTKLKMYILHVNQIYNVYNIIKIQITQ